MHTTAQDKIYNKQNKPIEKPCDCIPLSLLCESCTRRPTSARFRRDEMSNAIVVVGSCMMDFVCYAGKLPVEGETIHGTKFATNFGGKGANQCVAAAKLGGNATMVARVGDDIWGEKYKENFDKLNVNHKHVRKTSNQPNGIAQITVSESGANQIVIVPGANSKLCVEDVDAAKDEIEKAAVVLCQLETIPDVAIRAAELCQGISILNGAPALPNYDAKLITQPTIFCVNETEAAVFSGVPVRTVDDAKLAISSLLSRGCQCVIVTVGTQGAVFASQQDPLHQHVSAPKIDCIDSTGAGDAFLGALAYLLANHKDLSLKRCIEAACYVASDSCTRPGTQASYSGSNILDKFLKQNESSR